MGENYLYLHFSKIVSVKLGSNKARAVEKPLFSTSSTNIFEEHIPISEKNEYDERVIWMYKLKIFGEFPSV